MNRKQNNILTTGHSVSAMLETLTATSVAPAITATRTALVNLLNEINTQGDEQAMPLRPRTAMRNEQFEAAALATHRIARLVRGYALAAGDTALAGQVEFSRTDLAQGRFNRRLQAMRQVHAAAQARAAALAPEGLSSAMLADLETKIAAAAAGLAVPRSNIAARKLAIQNLVEAFDRLEHLLVYRLDPLMEELGQTDRQAWSRYLTARAVIDRPGTPAPDLDAAPRNQPKPAVASSSEPQPLAA